MISNITSSNFNNILQMITENLYDVVSQAGENLLVFNMRVASRLYKEEEMITALLSGVIYSSPLFLRIEDYDGYEYEDKEGINIPYILKEIEHQMMGYELTTDIIKSIEILYYVMDEPVSYMKEEDYKNFTKDLANDPIAFAVHSATVEVLDDMNGRNMLGEEGKQFRDRLRKNNSSIMNMICEPLK